MTAGKSFGLLLLNLLGLLLAGIGLLTIIGGGSCVLLAAFLIDGADLWTIGYAILVLVCGYGLWRLGRFLIRR